jgi:hypothetical protein
MVDEPNFSSDAKPSMQQLVDYFIDSLFDGKRVDQVQRAVYNGTAGGSTLAGGAAVAASDALLEFFGKFAAKIEEHVEHVAGPVLATIAGHLIGRPVSISELRRSASGEGNSELGGAVAKIAIDAMSGPPGELKPGQEGAERLLGTLAQLVFNGWFETTAFELITTAIPDMDSFESIAELPHDLIDALGLGRLSRVALRPLVQTCVATPLQWQVNKTYRPQLLAASEVIRQLTRGRWSREQVFEELARQGYSDDRIEALLAGAAKQLSIDDAFFLARVGTLTYNDVVTQLRAQGYEQETAELALNALRAKRIESIRDDSLAALKRAYTNRYISDSEFTNYISAIIPNDAEQAAVEVAAQTVRELNMQRLSHGEIRDAVTVGIASFGDYRRWMTLEGYESDDQLTLELLLRHSIDKTKLIDQHRAQALAERAAEKAARDEQRAAKLAQVESDRALKRRGTAGDLERAVVRGLIPIDRYAEVLRAGYDADTVQLLVSLVEDDRQRYLAQQAATDVARKRAGARNVDVGAVETAVLEDVISLDEFRTRLAGLGFAPADVALLAATVAAKKADRDKAAADRRDAALAASRKSINLARFEQLVRKGVRTMAQYDALLSSLGYDDASRAGILELLQLRIGDDASAATIRTSAAPALTAKGLSLEQFRRAVLLGQKSEADYQAFLVSQNFTADAIALLAAELHDDLDQADAARQRRDEAAATTSSRTLPLATIRRAVQLGVVSPDLYQQRLEETGYSSDDVAIEMDLLVTEIADIQAARARRAQLSSTTDARSLSLAQLERAVKAGVSPIDDYRAKAIELGYSAADVQTISGVLERELLQQADAQARHDQVAGELAARNLSLSQLEAAVKGGLKSVEQYGVDLAELGYAADDVDLLVELLQQKLGATETAP